MTLLGQNLICSCSQATALRCLRLSGVPLASLLCLRCTLARAFSSLRKKRGFSISSPLERVAKVFSPTSIPTCSGVCSKRSGSHSTENEAYHLPVLLL